MVSVDTTRASESFFNFANFGAINESGTVMRDEKARLNVIWNLGE